MIDQKLLRTIADADTDSKFWGSAAQEKALDILGILVGRSWCDDDFRAENMTAWAEYEYLEFINLLKQATKGE